MTTEESKEYMAKTEVHQLFEGMLTGLLYNKPEDPLAFLEGCISLAKEKGSDIKWNTFLDLNKKPLPPIPKVDGPIKSEGADVPTFTTEPGAEIKNRIPLPPIGANQHIDDDDKELQEKNIVTSGSESEEEEEVEFSGQRIVFVLGGPGSGKGTQCTRIVEKFGYVHLSAGDLLRAEVSKGSERGEMIESLMKEGKLVPKEITIALLKDAMRQHKEAPGFLIDGFPREIDQGMQFEQEIVEGDFVLFFDCSEEVMEQRLLKRGETSGRPDDNTETIKKRFTTFVEKTMPVIDHYERKNKVQRVNADGEVDTVFTEVCKIFGDLPPKEVRKIRRKKKKQTAVTEDEEEEEDEWEDFSGQRIVFVLGGPGSGKGTQCARAVEKFGFTHLSTGDLLRAELNKGNERGQMLAQIMEEGKLVPQDVVIQLLKDAMLLHPDSPGFLIDGFPREVSQGTQFESEVVECHFILFFDCSEATMEERLLKRAETSGRADDNAETIKKRLTTFVEKTMPVIETYEKLEKVKRIDANRSVEEVYEDVCKLFGELPKIERRRRKKGKKPQSGDESETYDEFVEAGDDLARLAAGKSIRRRKKKKRKDDEQEERPPINEEPIVAEELIPLMDQTIARTDGKALLNARVIFVIGGPGSGKGTQCARIVEKFGYTHFSTGDLLRAEVESGSPRGEMLSEKMEKGELVSNDIILELLRDAIVSKPHTKGFLVDGFPRELEQAQDFEKEIATCEFVLFFDCKNETMKSRLIRRGETSGRVDDNEETITKRLQTFEEQTVPVISYYGEKEKVKKVSAEGSPDDVFAEVSGIFEALPDRRSSTIHDYDVVFVIGGHRGKRSELSQSLADATNRTRISVGDILREEAGKDSDRGKEVADAIAVGGMVVTSLVLALLTERLASDEKNLEGYVIDGYPRSDEQMKNFTDKVSDFNKVIVLEGDDEVVAEEDEIGQNKAKVYSECTKPLVESLEKAARAVKFVVSLSNEEFVDQAKAQLTKQE